MNGRRRILVVAPWVPAPTSGFGTRVFQLCRGLARAHEVHVLCHAEPGDEDAVAQLSERVEAVHTVPAAGRARWRKRVVQATSLVSPVPFETRRLASASLQAAFDALVRHSSFDLVQVESTHLGRLDTRGLPVLLDEHNIEYELLARVAAASDSPIRKAYYRWDSVRTRRQERRMWRRVAACAVTSAREQDVVVRHAGATPTGVVPNGVDTEYFCPGDDADVDSASVVFVGTMHYQPNVDAAIHFIRNVLPLLWRDRPDVVFTAVGHSAPRELTRLAGPRVVVTGTVPDVRPFLRRAAAVVVPLRSGSGTRLKILEAMAVGRPVVSTRLGAEGLDATDGEHLVVAEEPGEFAGAVRRLLEDASSGAHLGTRARLFVEDRYSWHSAVRALDTLQCRVDRARCATAGLAAAAEGL